MKKLQLPGHQQKKASADSLEPRKSFTLFRKSDAPPTPVVSAPLTPPAPTENKTRRLSWTRRKSDTPVPTEVSADQSALELRKVCSALEWTCDTMVPLYKIGQGANGVVYKVRHQDVAHAVVAVKVLKEEMRESTQLCQFLRESDHRNVVHYYGWGQLGPERMYLVMDYCGVGSLEDLLKKTGPLRQQDSLSHVMSQIASGLLHVHKHNLVHGDVKPANVLCDARYSFKLADFQMDSSLNVSSAPRSPRPFPAGTPLYMSPELFQQQSMSAASDVWALGITAMYLAEGQVPRSKETIMRLAAMIVNDPAPVLEHPNDFSVEFIVFLNVSLEKDPTKRSSVADLSQMPFLEQATRLIPQQLMSSFQSLLDERQAGEEEKVRRYSNLTQRMSRNLTSENTMENDILYQFLTKKQ